MTKLEILDLCDRIEKTGVCPKFLEFLKVVGDEEFNRAIDKARELVGAEIEELRSTLPLGPQDSILEKAKAGIDEELSKHYL